MPISELAQKVLDNEARRESHFKSCSVTNRNTIAYLRANKQLEVKPCGTVRRLEEEAIDRALRSYKERRKYVRKPRKQTAKKIRHMVKLWLQDLAERALEERQSKKCMGIVKLWMERKQA